MNFPDLKAEILGNVPLYGLLSHADIAAELNAVNKQQAARVPVDEFIGYITRNDLLINLVTLSNDSVAAKARPAQVILWMLANPHVSDIDMTAAAFSGGIDKIEASGSLVSEVTTARGITAAQVKAEILNMSLKTSSRGNQLNLGEVTESDIKFALTGAY